MKNATQAGNVYTPPTEFRLRCLIPFSAAGVVIGKGGDHIRQIRQLYNCRMRVGENSDPYNTRERLITLQAEAIEPIVKGVQQVQLLLMKEATIGSYASLECNYGPAAAPPQQSMYPPQDYSTYQQQPQYSGYDANRRDPYAAAAPAGGQQYAGYSGYQQQQQQPQATQRQPVVQTQTPAVSVQSYGVQDLSSLEITPPSYQTDGVNITMTLGVPDHKVGTLIGKSGIIIKEIKQATGVSMQVSQKGDTIAGTAHRKVIVTGSQAQVQNAHSMIMQKLIADAANPRHNMS